MTEPLPEPVVAPPAPASRRSPLRTAIAVVVAASLAAMAGAVVALAVRPPSVSLLPPPTETHTEVAPTPDIVSAIKSLARLESVSYHVERVIDMSDEQKRVYGLVEAKDSILLVAVGDVIAGVDLGELSKDDVDADFESHKVSVKLPAPKIFSANLDEKATHVHSRRTDVLAVRHEDLEQRARQEAVRTMQKAAKDQGILDKARGNAESTVRSLLEASGFKEVEITFEE